jgi:hypothetical protein
MIKLSVSRQAQARLGPNPSLLLVLLMWIERYGRAQP